MKERREQNTFISYFIVYTNHECNVIANTKHTVFLTVKYNSSVSNKIISNHFNTRHLVAFHKKRKQSYLYTISLIFLDRFAIYYNTFCWRECFLEHRMRRIAPDATHTASKKCAEWP